MKTKKTSPIAVIISALYIVIVLAFVGSLAKEAHDGRVAAEKRFTELNRDVSRNLNSNELASDEFVDTFLDSIGNMADIASFEIESDGESIIYYPSSLVMAQSPSSPFIHSFSTGLNTKDGFPVTFKISIYQLKPSSIFYKGRIAFLATLCVTLFCIFYLIYLNLESSDEKNSLKAKKQNDDALSDEDIEDFTSEEDFNTDSANTEIQETSLDKNDSIEQEDDIDVADEDIPVDVSFESDDADEEKSIDSIRDDFIQEELEEDTEEVESESDLESEQNNDNLTTIYSSELSSSELDSSEQDDTEDFGDLDDIKLPDLPSDDDTSLTVMQEDKEDVSDNKDSLEEDTDDGDEDVSLDDITLSDDIDDQEDDTLNKEEVSLTEQELQQESYNDEPVTEDNILQEEPETEEPYNSQEETEKFNSANKEIEEEQEEEKIIEEDIELKEEETQEQEDSLYTTSSANTSNADSSEQKDEGPKGLFSSKTGFGWESYMIPRLDNELIRSASEEADIALFTICIENIDWESEVGKEISALILQTAKYPDFVFEHGKDGSCAIFPNTDTDLAINIADDLYTNIYTILEKHNKVLKIGIGISARSLRMISGSRLATESEVALKHAFADNSSPIVAFKVNPEKYRNYLASETESI